MSSKLIVHEFVYDLLHSMPSLHILFATSIFFWIFFRVIAQVPLCQFGLIILALQPYQFTKIVHQFHNYLYQFH